MTSIKRNLPWILCSLWLLIRIAIGTYIYPENSLKSMTFGVILNLSFIIVLIFSELVLLFKVRRFSKPESFLSEVKTVCTPVIRYVLGVGIAITLYYNFISNELQRKRESDYILTEQSLDTEQEINALREENNQLKNFSKEQILQAAHEKIDLMTNPKVVSSISFLALVFVGLLYSLFAVFLFRLFVRFQYKQ